MKRVLTIVLGGSGDLILGCQVTHHIQKKVGPENVELLCLARDETFEPIKLLFGDQMIIKQHELKEKWGEHYRLIYNPAILKQIKEDYSEIYVVCPDLLFRAREYSFDFNKYNCSPQTVVQTRLLTHKYQPENIIYCAFANTTTKGYAVSNRKSVLSQAALRLPDYNFYVPVLINWNGEEIIGAKENAELNSGLPSNILIDYQPSWERALNFMSRSRLIVTLDSGPLHIAYQYGLEIICLDPRFGYNNTNNILWHSRWRNQGMNNSIDISTPPELISRLIDVTLRIPQTSLLPKWFVLGHLENNWETRLGFKF